jgi:UDP-N-acetyl-2-amino-2-deoxyglucuronate dehydrogenase
VIESTAPAVIVPRFALTGAGGYIAPRHLQAIKDVGGRLVAALDPNDSVGVLDRFGYDVEFFTAPERFERHLYRARREGRGVDWLSVCSPNHLHDVHAYMGMRNGAHIICEKPLVLLPHNLDALEEVENETGRRVFSVLQLRHHPELLALKARLDVDPRPREVWLRYVTPRGRWYHQSWKGDETRSGGLITNIGIHLLDALLWLFGSVESIVSVRRVGEGFVSGVLQLQRAFVNWELSVDPDSGPIERSLRLFVDEGPDETITIEGASFTNLHTRVYEETLAGRGFGITDARPAVELAYRLRTVSSSG